MWDNFFNFFMPRPLVIATPVQGVVVFRNRMLRTVFVKLRMENGDIVQFTAAHADSLVNYRVFKNCDLDDILEVAPHELVNDTSVGNFYTVTSARNITKESANEVP